MNIKFYERQKYKIISEVVTAVLIFLDLKDLRDLKDLGDLRDLRDLFIVMFLWFVFLAFVFRIFQIVDEVMDGNGKLCKFRHEIASTNLLNGE